MTDADALTARTDKNTWQPSDEIDKYSQNFSLRRSKSRAIRLVVLDSTHTYGKFSNDHRHESSGIVRHDIGNH
jgi:hypothetical protein